MLTLLRQRNFGLLWFGGLVSFTGDWVFMVALPVYVFALTGSVLATGVMFMVAIVPNIVFGSLAGVLADRWDRRWTLVLCNLARGPLLLPLLFVQSTSSMWIIYIVALLDRTIGLVSSPAEHALLPKLVGEDHLVKANALNALNENLSRLIGPALGGVLFGWLGFASTVLVDAASFVVAGVMVALIAAPPSVTRATHEEAHAAADGAHKGLMRQWLAGLAMARRNRTVAALITLMAFNGLAEGILGVLMVVYARLMLSKGDGAMEFGWLLTAQAVGGLAGGLFVGRVSEYIKPRVLVWAGFVLLGVIDVLIFNIPNLPVDIALMIVVGLPVVGLQAGAMTLLQTSVADAFRGRMLGVNMMVYSVMLLLSTAFTSFFGSSVGIVPMLTLAGVMDALAGVAGFVLLPRAAVPALAEQTARPPTAVGQNTTAD